MKRKDCRYPVFLTVGLILALLGSAHPLQATTNIKVSGVMPSFGDVGNFQISPDGRYAVYLADQDTDGVNELYSVLLGGGSPVRLNPILPSGRNVYRFLISPDSSRVVYSANQETGNVELYSVPLGGPAAAGIKLNGALRSFGNVYELLVSPDSSRVVYRADQESATVELYSVPLGGPAAAGIKLNGAGGQPYNFQISPDSSRVVYQANQGTATVDELYSVLIYGPAAAGIKLNGALVPGGNVRDFLISPNNSRVIYQADQETDNVFELYSVPLSGPATAGIKINGALLALGNLSDFLISPDSSRVVYMADKLPRPQTVTVVELYSVPIGGPAAAGIKINGALVFIGNVINFLISPDSSRVVYRADQETDNVFELYSVPLGGPATAGIKINRALAAGRNVGNFLISPDSSRVVYQANQDTATVVELYSVPLAGPSAAGVKLNGTLVLNGNVKGFQISPDSGRVLYIADQDTDEVFELYMTSNYFLYLPLLLKQG